MAKKKAAPAVEPEKKAEKKAVMKPKEEAPAKIDPDSSVCVDEEIDIAFANAKNNALITGRGSFAACTPLGYPDYQVTVERV